VGRHEATLHSPASSGATSTQLFVSSFFAPDASSLDNLDSLDSRDLFRGGSPPACTWMTEMTEKHDNLKNQTHKKHILPKPEKSFWSFRRVITDDRQDRKIFLL
jgi:hypothetical protein